MPFLLKSKSEGQMISAMPSHKFGIPILGDKLHLINALHQQLNYIDTVAARGHNKNLSHNHHSYELSPSALTLMATRHIT